MYLYIYIYTSSCIDISSRMDVLSVDFSWPRRQVKERADWLKEKGLNFITSGNGSLQKQRVRILQACYQREVRCIEQAILDEVSFPATFNSTVTLHDDLHSGYRAVFDSGFEKFAKEDVSLAKLNTWLIGLTCSYKRGDLDKQMRKAQHLAKSDAALAKSASNLPAPSTHSFTTVLNELDESSKKNDPTESTTKMEGEDVTSSFLTVEKVFGPSCPQSFVCIHRGSFNAVIKSASSTTNLSGLLAGQVGWNNKFHVTDMILSTRTVESLMSDDPLMKKLQNMNLECCGCIVKGNEDDLRSQAKGLLNLFSYDYPLMIGVDTTKFRHDQTFCWEIERLEMLEDEKPLRSVSPSWSSNPRDNEQRLRYTICWEKDFGVSIMAATTERICEAVLDHFQEKTSRVEDSSLCSKQYEKIKYRSINVPPDGLCGWHSLIAAENIEKYEKIPRKTSGYALNTRFLSEEELAAKNLCASVCEKALELCEESWYDSIRRVQQEGQFGPFDLSWISKAVGISIRCTCSKEARDLNVSLCSNILIYIYIYS